MRPLVLPGISMASSNKRGREANSEESTAPVWHVSHERIDRGAVHEGNGPFIHEGNGPFMHEGNGPFSYYNYITD